MRYSGYVFRLYLGFRSATSSDKFVYDVVRDGEQRLLLNQLSRFITNTHKAGKKNTAFPSIRQIGLTQKMQGVYLEFMKLGLIKSSNEWAFGTI